MQHIPNFLTLCNLCCGFLAIFLSFQLHFQGAAYLIFAGTVFDFLDGLAARALKAYSPMGKQLDSMADLITFGVAPGALVLVVLNGFALNFELTGQLPLELNKSYDLNGKPFAIISLVAIIIPVAAAVRLARFNISETQQTDFKGLPSPACGIFFALMAMSLNENAEEIAHFSLQTVFSIPSLLLMTAIISFMMISNLPMPSLKISGFAGIENKKRLMVAFMLVLLPIVGIVVNKIFLVMWFAVPLYIILSLILYLTTKKRHEI